MQNSLLPQVGNTKVWHMDHEIKRIYSMIHCKDILENDKFQFFLLYAKYKLTTEHALNWRQVVFNKPKLILYKVYRKPVKC